MGYTPQANALHTDIEYSHTLFERARVSTAKDTVIRPVEELTSKPLGESIAAHV